MKRVLPIALAVAAGLAGVVYLELEGAAEPDAGAVPGRPLAPAAAAAPAPHREDAAQDWAATALGRPLFSADRRPVHAVDATAAKAAQDMRLTGVIAGPFGRRAILVVRATPSRSSSRPGTASAAPWSARSARARSWLKTTAPSERWRCHS